MKVLFYGRLAETIRPELELEVTPSCSIAELRNKLIAEHPEAEGVLRSDRSRACVGETLVHEGYVLQATDTVEFLPPVSGG